MTLKKLLFLSSIIVLHASLQAMQQTIVLPDAIALEHRLKKAGFQYFIKNSSIINELAGQIRNDHWSITVSINFAVYDYIAAIKISDRRPWCNLDRLKIHIKNQLLQILLEDQYELYVKMTHDL